MFTCTLPLPAPLNRLYRVNQRTGRPYKSQEARQWEQEAGWAIKKAKGRQKPLQGDLEITITMYLKYSRDWDSSQKLLCDVMQKQGVYENDKQIKAGHIFIEKDKANPRLEVTVYPLE